MKTLLAFLLTAFTVGCASHPRFQFVQAVEPAGTDRTGLQTFRILIFFDNKTSKTCIGNPESPLISQDHVAYGEACSTLAKDSP
jgi:hypothetical protein